MAYTKEIEQTDTGMVIAYVWDVRGERVGLEFFYWPPFFQAARLRRAHKWADRWVANCEKYCTTRAAQQSKGEKP
jgi:hypothetical protein